MPDFEIFPGDLKNVSEAGEAIEKVKEKSDLSTTGLLQAILSSAIALKASDIHFETGKEEVRIKFRVDGLLYEVSSLTGDAYALILNRGKLLSGLKINVRDVPQDGRFTVKLEEKDIEIRTSTIPAEFGETIVLRVLDPQAISLQISDLGMREDDEEIVLNELKKPNGMILVTGPTGSGKTTTLYAFLKTVKKPELKIVTIEDPIEYHLDGIEQTQVDEEAGYVFSSGLKSILRQDPDIILVGEIRDLETAEIAFHAALTGHLVFSTLHTNSAVGAVPRLVDLGVKSPIIGPALNLIIAERLVRKLCLVCRSEVEITDGLKTKIEKFIKNLPAKAKKMVPKEYKIYKSSGCGECHQGYRGRIGVFELMEFTDDLRELINKEATEVSIGKLARREGLVTVQEDGLIKVFEGVTDLAEVERVTGPIEW
ncbi:MAG: type II/IV secretion system protein [Candidatus Colwellbacteria bacterium]|nr:type II/IV secretion system protein [Candidatus Colwellbacteria bacterium]